jgi:hypothetical protein
MNGMIPPEYSTSRSLLGWPLYISIYSASIDNYHYLEYFMDGMGLNDLIIVE